MSNIWLHQAVISIYQRLNSIQMAKEEYFSQFKAKWDIVVLEWILLHHREAINDRPDQFKYLKLSIVQDRLLGLKLFQQLHPQTNHYVEDEWLYDKLTDVFLTFLNLLMTNQLQEITLLAQYIPAKKF
jgi:hypothetical protein